MSAALSLRLMDSSSNPASLSRFHMASSLKGVFKTLAEPEFGDSAIVAVLVGVTANFSEREDEVAIDWSNSKSNPSVAIPFSWISTANRLIFELGFLNFSSYFFTSEESLWTPRLTLFLSTSFHFYMVISEITSIRRRIRIKKGK